MEKKVMRVLSFLGFILLLAACDNKETALPEERTEQMSAAEKYYHLQRMRKYEQERKVAEEMDKSTQPADNIGYVEDFNRQYQEDYSQVEPLTPSTE
ncbi:MAG: hypothetical protein K1X55_15775 [Chitinophagales bacterium]|nr:hypothetical protein [Chitinophagales bacterium]